MLLKIVPKNLHRQYCLKLASVSIITEFLDGDGGYVDG